MAKKHQNALWQSLKGNIFSIVFFLLIVGLFFGGVNDAQSSSSSEGLRMTEESVMRAAVTCYAIEGSYPDSLEYMEQNYGLAIDKKRYVVYYEAIAANLVPSVTVIDTAALQ